MKAYHLRTSEPDRHDPTGFESFTLDSIYVPDRKILVGFINWHNMRGMILNYSNVYHNRAQAIAAGNTEPMGKVISIRDLDSDVVDKIASNAHEAEIKITQEYDGSTEVLVGILSGKLRRRGFLERLLAIDRASLV